MHHAPCEPLLPVPPGATLLLIKPGERRRILIIEKGADQIHQVSLAVSSR